MQVGRNIVHGSDAPDSAEAEINLWFKEGEVVGYSKTVEPWVYGK
jgi:nucleoside-diphosphate kinase